MNIKDFTNMEQFERIMSNWADSTGLATVAVGADGNYISQCYNFTDFCMQLKTKDFAYTRISRVFLHILLQIRQEDYAFWRSRS